MSELLDLQLAFPKHLALLLNHFEEMGFKCTLGEAWRTPEQAAIYAAQGKGITYSEHINKLAIDLNLFKQGPSPDPEGAIPGPWLYQADSAAYAELGAYWKTLHPAARWGGDFKRQDGNHFSFEYQGVQ